MAGIGIRRSTRSRTSATPPSLPLALAMARYFGVTVEEIFDDQQA
jgi:DNA-binding XRE family transcriptional regulator